MPTLTTEQIEQRKRTAEFYGRGYSAAAQAKGCMLSEAEMIRVRTRMDAGDTPEQIAAEFARPSQQAEQSTRQIFDSFARSLAGLREELEIQAQRIKQLEQDVNTQGLSLHQAQEELARLSKKKAA